MDVPQQNQGGEPLSVESSSSKITSTDIKIAVLSKYRYKLQMIAADEVGYMLGNTDVSVFDSGILTEIEIKISKSDLWNGELKKKEKHEVYLKPDPTKLRRYQIPHFFYICVPSVLVDEAKKWTKSINKNYGVLEYKQDTGIYKKKPEDTIYIRQKAKKLHEVLYEAGWKKLARRLSSANIILKTKLKERTDNGK